MPTVRNSTAEEVCIRTGKGSFDYHFYFVPANEKITVSEAEAKLIAARVKQTNTVGITVSKILRKPLLKKKAKKAVGGEASTEIN